MKNARFPLSSYQRQHTRAAILPKNSSCALDNCSNAYSPLPLDIYETFVF